MRDHLKEKGPIMAKDKSKKKTDEKVDKKKSKGGGFAKPSEAPATGGDGFRLEHEDHVGDLFLITPLREDSVTTEKFGDAEIIVCDVVHLDEKKPEKSEAHENVYVFGGWVKGSLRGYIDSGQRVLARLGQDASKSKSKSPAWVLEDADEDDIKVATEYVEYVNNPLNAPKKGGKADGKKAKKK